MNLKNKKILINKYQWIDDKIITKDISGFRKVDVKEAVLDFNFFCKYMKVKSGLGEEVHNRIFEIMGKYDLTPKYLNESWTVQEVSIAIFGDFGK